MEYKAFIEAEEHEIPHLVTALEEAGIKILSIMEPNPASYSRVPSLGRRPRIIFNTKYVIRVEAAIDELLPIVNKVNAFLKEQQA